MARTLAGFRVVFAVLAFLAAVRIDHARARILTVGPGADFNLPSLAVAAAGSGDTIRIASGRYADCAIVRQDDLVIEASGPGVVLADRTCAGKALLVIDGNNVTVRGLTLQHARVPDRNGAGIRAEGGNLRVEATRFIDNENGILSGDNPHATVRVIGSTFIGNGTCEGGCAHAIYAGAVALLHVEHSRFLATHAGHNIKSRARWTEVIDCDIQDGPDGSSSYLVELPNGGSLTLENSVLEKGPHTSNAANAIMIGAEGVKRPAGELLVRGNRFINDQNRPTIFVHNLSDTPAVLTGNVLIGPVQALVGAGTVR
jgi:hypothetical protein